MSKNNKKRKNFIWNLIGSSIYAFTSLIYMIIVTRINGLEAAGIFTFAFSFICIIQVVGTYAGRTYQVTERDRNIKDCDYLYFRIINILCMIILTITFVLIKGYSEDKFIIFIMLLAYRIFDAYSEAIYGIFQKNNNLYQAGISLTLRSILTVCSFLAIDIVTHNLFYSLTALVLTNITVFFVYDIRLLTKYKIKLYSLNLKKIKNLTIGGLSVFLFTLLMQYVVNAQKFAIDDLLSHDSQAIFGIILMPATLMTLCSQFIINPFIYDMNEYIKRGNHKKFKLLTINICLVIFFVGVIALIVSYFIGIPILNILYDINIWDNLLPFLIIILGSIFYGMSMAISNALIAIRKNAIQLLLYIFISIFALISSYVLTYTYGLLGSSLAYCITVMLLFTMFAVIFIMITRKLKCK